MAEDPIPSAEPEISAPPTAAPPNPARPDPGVIDGEATEIRDEAAAPPGAQSLDAPPPDEPNRRDAYVLPAAAGLVGAILGAALALLAAWLVDPRAGALDATRVRLAALQAAVDSQSSATAALDKRLGASETGGVQKDALAALGRRVDALEAAGGAVKTALDETRADAAKALAAAQAAPPATNSAAPAEPAALDPRFARLESDLAAAQSRLDRLEGASGAASKSDARVPIAKGGSEDAASVVALALSLDQRFAAGAPYAAELAGLARLDVSADALAPLKPFAETGAPSLATLAARWASVEPAVAAAAPPPARSGWDRLFDHMRALVRVRRVGEAAENDPAEPPAARVGAALQRGDLAAALEAYGQLPDAARAAGAAWAEAAKARATAAAAAAALRAEAIGRLAAAKD